MPFPHYGQPRYRAVADELRRRIETGTIRPGTLLPAESILTAEFRVSRGTIRQAIAVLRNEHLVTTEHGRGTYANACRHASGPGAELEARERHVSADPELAALFAVEVGTVLLEHESVTRTNGTVGLVVRTYQLLQAEQ
ncbi:GntR family transcriptional regulator [Micromonospora echinospora]|uniref:GntR family transcriptional regulator n=1 Tax=Micromonospora echinospora TaxID=1877 RepID=UPI00379C211E